MRKTIHFVVILSAVVLGAGWGIGSAPRAWAQDAGEEAPRQVALNQTMIDGLIVAQAEMSALQAKAQGGEQPDAQMQGKMEAIAKKVGFASLETYGEAADSVSIVLSGMDPDTKSYVGPVAIIKKQMAQVEADKSLPAKDKAQTLQEMKAALASAGSVKPLPGNIDLVAKNYEKLSEGFQSGE